MDDQHFAFSLFAAGFVLMIISMVAGPFGAVKWSIFTAAVACCLALAAASIGFLAWDEPLETPKNEDRSKTGRGDGHISK